MKLFLILAAFTAVVIADVSELPTSEYLPPIKGNTGISNPSQDYLPPRSGGISISASEISSGHAEPAPAHELGEDGYKYKTARRIRYRRRRY